VYEGRHHTYGAAFVEGLYDHEVEELFVEAEAELARVRGIATGSRTQPGIPDRPNR
jgi:hypothetical protein